MSMIHNENDDDNIGIQNLKMKVNNFWRIFDGQISVSTVQEWAYNDLNAQLTVAELNEGVRGPEFLLEVLINNLELRVPESLTQVQEIEEDMSLEEDDEDELLEEDEGNLQVNVTFIDDGKSITFTQSLLSPGLPVEEVDRCISRILTSHVAELELTTTIVVTFGNRS